jgi:hypothetical protein
VLYLQLSMIMVQAAMVNISSTQVVAAEAAAKIIPLH